MNRLHLPKKLISLMLDHLLSQDIYESPSRHSNRHYQQLHRNRLIASYILSTLDNKKHLQKVLTQYDLDRQFMYYPYHEIHDSLFINTT